MKSVLAEFVGTFGLIYVVTAAAVLQIGHLGVSLSHLVILCVIIYPFQTISGAHFNPVISMVFWIRKKITTKTFVEYITSQLAAAAFASFVLSITLGKGTNLAPTLPANGMVVESFFLEILLTFILLCTILFVSQSHNRRISRGLLGATVGGAVAFDVFFGGPISGASMNPARTFGPAVMNWNFEYFYIYVIAPVIGGLLALFTFYLVKEKKKPSNNKP
ncbi:MAG: MIP/aquaporin family protein [Nitrosopumilaceae archaeon]